MEVKRKADSTALFGSATTVGYRKKTKPSEDHTQDLIHVHDWHRTPLAPFDPSTTSISMMQVETDYEIKNISPQSPPSSDSSQSSQSPQSSHPTSTATSDSPTTALNDGNSREAVIRIFGITAEGNAILMHIHGFTSYFYVTLPANASSTFISEFQSQLNLRLLNETRGDNKNLTTAVLAVEPVELQSVWGYNPVGRSTFLKISVATPPLVATARRLLEEGINNNTYITYESNVPYILRYMIDQDMSGGSWVEAPAGKYTVRPPSNCESRMQCEIDIHYTDIISHKSEGDWIGMAPLRVLSIDIECSGRKGHFPTAEQDPVIQIGAVLSLSNNIAKPIRKTIFTLDTCSPITGAEVVSSPTEVELLDTFQKFFLEVDADIIIGYNTINFDFPYLLDRARVLQIPSFPYLGRLKNVPTRIKSAKFESRAIGKQENKEMNIEGRIQFDVLLALRRDYKLRSYSLNAVSTEFLKQQKEDVHHSIISDLQNGDAETRKRLAEYCLKDSILPLRLMEKLMLWINYVEMARVTGVPINFLLSRGQSIKVISQILRRAKTHGMVVPVLKKTATDDKYEGATVIEPNRGYYADPIATLDFASLYPSIMMAHNLCYTTLTTSSMYLKLGPDKVSKTPHGDYFVKQDLKKGLLPEILEDLLKARKKAKRDMESAPDAFTKAVLNGRQLALKISANSVYGFTGAQVGQLPCLAISSSVTSYGREMIEATKKTVEEHYTKKNGYEYDAEVVYGDTDSVMIKFGTPNLEESMRLGTEAADVVSKIFISPIKLEFEKVYYPFLLMNKKRYAGLYWTRPDKWDKIDTKGIETVRRDNCALVKNVVTEVLETILVQRSPSKAIEVVKNVVSELLQGRVDLSLLVISKSLGKGASSEDYAAKQAHVELAERMRKRDPSMAPAVGDRVPYVIIKAAKNAPNYEKSEDPIHVLEHDIPIDTDYYLDNQLKLPLVRIFEPILGPNAGKMLFDGDHTVKIKVSTSSAGDIMKFTKKTENCIGCKVPLLAGKRTLCLKCEPKRGEIYIKKVDEAREYEQNFGKLWSQCQRCQGSIHQEVLCSSRDCPIFYHRKKVQLTLNEITQNLEKFSFE